MNVIDTLRIYQALKEYLPSEAAQLIAQTFGYLYGEVSEGLKKKDLDEVRDSIAKLEEGQSNVAKHLEAIDQRLLQLAEAQIRTEQRVEELAVAQARTEQRLEDLAAAQARTEKRLEELATAQARTEQRLEELAAAQARTEQRLETSPPPRLALKSASIP
jgi:chromosome segregation ATPase